jgi:predicted  nucleic acid-binding Zn-ribbon protein
MAIDDFKHLIEAQSLERSIKEHLTSISEQESRVKHIVKQREIFSKETEELTSVLDGKNLLLNKFEKDLASADSKLEKTMEHIPLARNENETTALQNEVDSLTPRIESLQDDILNLIEECELLEVSIKEKVVFLEGSAKSLEEISVEADKTKFKHQSEIEVLEERVNVLFNQVHDNYKTAYLISCETHKFNNPLCFVTGGACSVCRFTLNQMQADEIEKGGITESCHGCGRLLTPLSAKNL